MQRLPVPRTPAHSCNPLTPDAAAAQPEDEDGGDEDEEVLLHAFISLAALFEF